ncbi:hypothetical protein CC80DRAFT_447427 [Byssothecium circinans]|uniref:C2H2-type domain-containing protein n=1 Tax=Byssothecium circinans TaxID=147558 RepID=A0A6A5TRS5_9PLEO|nr:hypothetical protein CC80DRAFT_447427 [Byssothecium circinans]
MDHHFSLGANHSSSHFGEEEDMDISMDASAAFPYAQQYIPHDQQAAYVNHNSYTFLQGSEQYPSLNFDYPTQRSHNRQPSTSTQSSYSSAFRSSNGSTFSQWRPRNSIASTNTAWSQVEYSEEQQIALTASALESRSLVASPPPHAPFEESTAVPSAKRAAPRQQALKRDPFETCVSRRKRSRPAQKLSRYWCTSCEEGFGEKYDWKRHEETYQERTEMFECDLCENVYFLDKDFAQHHQKSHRCRVCGPKHHVDLARRKRMARTGWGCGFCNHFSSDWGERCNHIDGHFQKENKTMDDWHHSQVIFSLLQRPEILPHWNRLLEIKKRTRSAFRWKSHNSGRVEGFPESNPSPQLQDLLEYWTRDQDIAPIVNLGFKLGLKEKELPRLPEPEEGHEPMQQHQSPQALTHLPAASHRLADEIPPWSSFLDTIIEDSLQPTGAIDLEAFNSAFNNSQDFLFPH